jgi:predicted secreted hydrolase
MCGSTTGRSKLVGDSYAATIVARDFQFDLRFAPAQAALLQGEAGFSAQRADHRERELLLQSAAVAATGRVAVGGTSASVTGTAWLDHEWSSAAMASDASGWDWIGINLDDGGALMAFRMRDHSGARYWAGGTLRDSSGASRSFAPGEIRFDPQRLWRSPRTSAEYPVAMRVNAGGEDYVLEPLMDDQELDSRASTGTVYWEGAVRALRVGREVGRGYLELTGYWRALKL